MESYVFGFVLVGSGSDLLSQVSNSLAVGRYVGYRCSAVFTVTLALKDSDKASDTTTFNPWAKLRGGSGGLSPPLLSSSKVGMGWATANVMVFTAG